MPRIWRIAQARLAENRAAQEQYKQYSRRVARQLTEHEMLHHVDHALYD